MSDIGNRQIFSANLRRIMTERNLERMDICNALGFKYSTFTDWYNGNKYPRIDNIEKLADYFGVQKSDLIEKESNPNDLDKQLEGIDFALWGEVQDLTDEEKQDIINFARFTKSKRNN